MNGGDQPKSAQVIGIADEFNAWCISFLALLFVALYGAALMGWLKPLADENMLLRLEPIIFLMIGYCFSWVPGQQNEKILNQEINRQTQRADAAQSAKKQTRQSSAALEEKIKKALAVLSFESRVTGRSSEGDPSKSVRAIPEEELRYVVTATLRTLNL